jgi:hypothetical protein
VNAKILRTAALPAAMLALLAIYASALIVSFLG